MKPMTAMQRRIEGAQLPLHNSRGPGRWPVVCRRLRRKPGGGWEIAVGVEGYRLQIDRGWGKVWLGRGHPYAAKSGQQWMHRFLAMAALGRRLLSSEHVHHVNGDRMTTDLSQLEVVAAEYHGRLHAYITTLAGGRGPDGRFVELDEPGPTRWAPRYCAIIGAAAIPLLRADQ